MNKGLIVLFAVFALTGCSTSTTWQKENNTHYVSVEAKENITITNSATQTKVTVLPILRIGCNQPGELLVTMEVGELVVEKSIIPVLIAYDSNYDQPQNEISYYPFIGKQLGQNDYIFIFEDYKAILSDISAHDLMSIGFFSLQSQSYEWADFNVSGFEKVGESMLQYCLN